MSNYDAVCDVLFGGQGFSIHVRGQRALHQDSESAPVVAGSASGRVQITNQEGALPQSGERAVGGIAATPQQSHSIGEAPPPGPCSIAVTLNHGTSARDVVSVGRVVWTEPDQEGNVWVLMRVDDRGAQAMDNPFNPYVGLSPTGRAGDTWSEVSLLPVSAARGGVETTARQFYECPIDRMFRKGAQSTLQTIMRGQGYHPLV